MKTPQSLALVLLMLGSRLAGQAGPPPAPDFLLSPLVDNNRALVLLTKEVSFSFILPHGWRAQAQPAMRQILLRHHSADALIVLSFPEISGKAPPAGEWIAGLKQRYPGAQQIDSPDLQALSVPAAACDLEWLHQGRLRQSGRFARILWKNSVLEFALTGNSEAFEEFLPALTHLMLSFRAGAPGRPVQVEPRLPE